MQANVLEVKARANQAKLEQVIANIHPATRQPRHKALYASIVLHLQQSNVGRCRIWSQAVVRNNFDDWLSGAGPHEKPDLSLFLATKAAHDSLNHHRNDKFDQVVAKRELMEWAEEQLYAKDQSEDPSEGPKVSGEDSPAGKILKLEESDSDIKLESVETAVSIAAKAPFPPKSRPSQLSTAPSQPFVAQVFSLKPEAPKSAPKKREPQPDPRVTPRKRAASTLATPLTPPPRAKKVKMESVGCQTQVAYVEVSTQTIHEAPPQPAPITTSTSCISSSTAALPSANACTPAAQYRHSPPHDNSSDPSQGGHTIAAPTQFPHLQAQIEALVSAAIARQTEPLQQAMPSTMRGNLQTTLSDAMMEEMMAMQRQTDPQRGRMVRSMDFGGGMVPTPSSRAVSRLTPAYFDTDRRSGRSGTWSGIWDPAEFDTGMDRWDYSRGPFFRRD